MQSVFTTWNFLILNQCYMKCLWLPEGDIKGGMETDSLENVNVDVCLVTSHQGSHSSTVHMYSVDLYNFFMLKHTLISVVL